MITWSTIVLPERRSPRDMVLLWQLRYPNGPFCRRPFPSPAGVSWVLERRERCYLQKQRDPTNSRTGLQSPPFFLSTYRGVARSLQAFEFDPLTVAIAVLTETPSSPNPREVSVESFNSPSGQVSRHYPNSLTLSLDSSVLLSVIHPYGPRFGCNTQPAHSKTYHSTRGRQSVYGLRRLLWL